MKCNDCGLLFSTDRRMRDDVCDSCWETRAKLVNGELILIGTPDFIKLQKKMAYGRGTAKRFLDSLLENKR